MIKTKRKGFLFLRSYFDVYNKLQNDDDKLLFLSAILKKQFLNKDPEGLEFPVDLAYDSQINAIDGSVKGWIRANKTDLQGNPISDTPPTPPQGKTKDTPPTPPQGKTITPPREEKEKEEEKEKRNNVELTLDEKIDKVIEHLNKISGRNFSKKPKSIRTMISARIKEGYSGTDFMNVIKDRVRVWGNDPEMKKYIRPATFFNSKKFDGYVVDANEYLKSNNRPKPRRLNHDEVFGKKKAN